MKKTETEDGYYISDEDSEIDINSMLEPLIESGTITKRLSILGKEIKLIKDDIEYVGYLKKFLLKETSEGKTMITVVFDLKS